MDVTVTHLNHRLALQIPAELPLGLVFVVGRVGELRGEDNGRFTPTQFTLMEQDCRVRCVLSARAAAETTLQEGDTIRAGGHLAFDPRRADYFLRVRDVEIIPPLPERPPLSPFAGQEALAAALAGIKKRSATADLPDGDLPAWVRRIAPPEVQKQMLLEEAEERGEETAVSLSPFTTETLPPLSDTVLERLSAAMESEEEVELTPDFLADLLPSLVQSHSPGPAPEEPPEIWQEEVSARSPVVGYEDPDAQVPRAQASDDFMRLLLVVFLVLAILIVVAILMML